MTTATMQHPRYQLDHWIAAGGMGEVWQATDLLLEREVAVKVLRRELGQDPVVRARFVAEARHAGALQHPHVASVLDYGEITLEEQPPLPFLVMELVDGQPLSALLAAGEPLPPDVAADLIAQAAEGLQAAHGLGIVHRDVKPGNLLVTASGQVKVTDFGVARAANAASLTLTGHLIGTPHYLSPEQAEGASATAVSDVYALGIVLYECLTGRKPFAGESPVSTALMQIRDPLPPFPPGIPERLRHITSVATAKEPAERFRSAGAMAAALRDESPETKTFVLPQPDAAPVPPETPERHDVAGAGAGRRRTALAGVAALLLVAGGLWALSAAHGGPDPAASAVRDDRTVQQLRPPVSLARNSEPSPAPEAGRSTSGTSQPAGPGPGTGHAPPPKHAKASGPAKHPPKHHKPPKHSKHHQPGKPGKAGHPPGPKKPPAQGHPKGKGAKGHGGPKGPGGGGKAKPGKGGKR